MMVVAYSKSKKWYWYPDNTARLQVVDNSNNLDSYWDAAQWDLFFLDSNGTYVTDFIIKNWDYNKVYNQIINLLP